MVVSVCRPSGSDADHISRFKIHYYSPDELRWVGLPYWLPTSGRNRIGLTAWSLLFMTPDTRTPLHVFSLDPAHKTRVLPEVLGIWTIKGPMLFSIATLLDDAPVSERQKIPQNTCRVYPGSAFRKRTDALMYRSVFECIYVAIMPLK